MADTKTRNCTTCKALVWTIDIPNKRSGNCWRCEVKALKDENDRLAAENKRLSEE